MPDIVLSTINSRYAHASFGLRYLMANLDPELRDRASIVEFDLREDPLNIVGAILQLEPTVVGFGVYIWNVSKLTEVVSSLKRASPQTQVILGGPEVSFELEDREIVLNADYVIKGEGDLAFSSLCRSLIHGEQPETRIIDSPPPTFDTLSLPYTFYTDEDIRHRVLYVEASRGCPFACTFCLSSLARGVRYAPIEPFLFALETLLERGARKLKFVDRTFNLHLPFATAILEFFLRRIESEKELKNELFLHFEMVPDRFDPLLRDLVARFPKGVLQFEVGIQSFDPTVSSGLSRRLDIPKVDENLIFLRDHVHLHADLIVGLPGEDVRTFAHGFDHLVSLLPHEIQVGILKRLRGTPMARDAESLGLVFASHPPYEVLRTREMNSKTISSLRRFAHHWDRMANSGNFTKTLPLVWQGNPSPFDGFMRMSHWLEERHGQAHSLSLHALMESTLDYLVSEIGHPAEKVADSLWLDYQGGGRSDKPAFLREHLKAMPLLNGSPKSIQGQEDPSEPLRQGAERQRRHQRIRREP